MLTHPSPWPAKSSVSPIRSAKRSDKVWVLGVFGCFWGIPIYGKPHMCTINPTDSQVISTTWRFNPQAPPFMSDWSMRISSRKSTNFSRFRKKKNIFPCFFCLIAVMWTTISPHYIPKICYLFWGVEGYDGEPEATWDLVVNKHSWDLIVFKRQNKNNKHQHIHRIYIYICIHIHISLYILPCTI